MGDARGPKPCTGMAPHLPQQVRAYRGPSVPFRACKTLPMSSLLFAANSAVSFCTCFPPCTHACPWWWRAKGSCPTNAVWSWQVTQQPIAAALKAPQDARHSVTPQLSDCCVIHKVCQGSSSTFSTVKKESPSGPYTFAESDPVASCSCN